MKSINLQAIFKFVVLLFWFLILVLVGKNTLDYYNRSQNVSLELVEAYRPSLNVGLVEEALEVLKKE